MKEKVKKTIDNIFMVLLIFTLIASAILMRKSKYSYIIRVVILILTILYIIIRKIEKDPVKIINNKLDIMVLAFAITSFVPIIFQSYVSIGTSVTVALNYISLYFLFVLVRQLCSRKNINIEYINIYIIVQAVIFVLLGIENLTTDKIFSIIGINNIINGEGRLVSLFGNPNVLASYLLFSFFIALHSCIYTEKTSKKILLNIANVLIFIGIILTYSKAILVLIPIISVIYIICIKNKKKNIEILANIVSYILIALIYIFAFNKLTAIEAYAFIWIFLSLAVIVEILVTLFINRASEYIKDIKIKYIVIVVCIICILLTIWLCIQLKNTIPYEIFNTNNTSNYEAKKINNIKGNTEYTLKFNLEANAYTDDFDNIEDMYEINVIERDSKNVEIKNTAIKFGNFTGEKEIKIYTHPNTSEFKIEFKAKYKYINRKFTVYKLLMNDQEIPLQYKNLPIRLVDKIKDINLNYKTAQERIQFIKDALKLSKDNLLTGIGGECWQYKYGQVQDYDYISSDIHSYPIQILLEFGIFGFIVLIGIYVYIMAMKTDKTKYLGIKMGLLVIFIHSAIDSEMKIQFMQLIAFTYFAIFSSIKGNSIEVSKKVNEICNIGNILIAVTTIFLILNPSLYVLRTTIGSRKDLFINKQKLTAIESYEQLLKYEKYDNINNDTALLIEYIKEERMDKIEELYLRIKSEQCEWKQRPEIIIGKSLDIEDIIKNMESLNNPKFYPWIVKFAELQMSERKQTLEMLEEALSKKYIMLDSSSEYDMLEESNKYIDDMYNKYKLGVAIINSSDQELPSIEALNDIDINITNKDILIYHTHTTEAYYAKEQYEETEPGKTLDENYNILVVGDVFKENLKKKGYDAIQLRNYNDLPKVDGAYARSKEILEEQLKKKDYQIIFDVHRDAGKLDKIGSFININGKNVANMRFVIASGHENWIKNLKWAITIQKQADEMYPGLFRPILIYNNQYNQDVSEFATLIEIGGDGNTLEEAENSVECLSDVLEKILK